MSRTISIHIEVPDDMEIEARNVAFRAANTISEALYDPVHGDQDEQPFSVSVYEPTDA